MISGDCAHGELTMTNVRITIHSNEYQAICDAIQCVQEQLDVLNEGVDNQSNVDGYIDQQGIDDAIICKERTMMDLQDLRTRLEIPLD